MEDRTFDRISRAMAGTTSRRQALKLLGGGIAGGALATGLSLQHTSAGTNGGGLNFPVNFISQLGSFVGTFSVTEFVAQGGRLLAVGTLTGEVFDAAGESLGTISQALTLPVRQTSAGTCQVLHLELGPLNLELLGLHVHLNKIVLDITAEEGGGLLGDLLCSLAGGLGGGPLAGLANLLNQLLGALGGV